MCGCKRRRAARAAWLEQRAAGGGCGRGFGQGPPFRPPLMGGPFGRWRDAPRDDYSREDPSQLERAVPRDLPTASREPEKTPAPRNTENAALSRDADKQKQQASQMEPARVSFASGPFSRWRSSIRNADSRRTSTTTLPPRYTSGVPEMPVMTKATSGNRESLPPAYDASVKN